MNDKRQKNQLELAFVEEYRSEAPNGPGEGTESFTAKRGTESPAYEQLMEEVCEQANCKQALVSGLPVGACSASMEASQGE